MPIAVKERISFKPPKAIRKISLKPPKALTDTVKKIGRSALDVVTAGTLDPAVIPAIEAYRAGLRAQAHWKHLPPALIRKAQPFYATDLRKVTYAEKIATGHGMAITFDRTIYFPRTLDLHVHKDLQWMLHELKHVDQYKEAGGCAAFYHKYTKQIAGEVLKRRRLNVHDVLELERAADDHAARIIAQIHGKW